MEHGEFKIGGTFWTAAGQFRCTDIGTRTIVAIRLGPREIITVETVGNVRQETTVIDDDPRWLNGTPYPAAEIVFDEDDLIACYRTEVEMRAHFA
jgi:hypothetical protein